MFIRYSLKILWLTFPSFGFEFRCAVLVVTTVIERKTDLRGRRVVAHWISKAVKRRTEEQQHFFF